MHPILRRSQKVVLALFSPINGLKTVSVETAAVAIGKAAEGVP